MINGDSLTERRVFGLIVGKVPGESGGAQRIVHGRCLGRVALGHNHIGHQGRKFSRHLVRLPGILNLKRGHWGDRQQVGERQQIGLRLRLHIDLNSGDAGQLQILGQESGQRLRLFQRTGEAAINQAGGILIQQLIGSGGGEDGHLQRLQDRQVFDQRCTVIGADDGDGVALAESSDRPLTGSPGRTAR